MTKKRNVHPTSKDEEVSRKKKNKREADLPTGKDKKKPTGKRKKI